MTLEANVAGVERGLLARRSPSTRTSSSRRPPTSTATRRRRSARTATSSSARRRPAAGRTPSRSSTTSTSRWRSREERGLRVTILRLFGSYGPRNHPSWWGGPQAAFIETPARRRASSTSTATASRSARSRTSPTPSTASSARCGRPRPAARSSTSAATQPTTILELATAVHEVTLGIGLPAARALRPLRGAAGQVPGRPPCASRTRRRRAGFSASRPAIPLARGSGTDARVASRAPGRMLEDVARMRFAEPRMRTARAVGVRTGSACCVDPPAGASGVARQRPRRPRLDSRCPARRRTRSTAARAPRRINTALTPAGVTGTSYSDTTAANGTTYYYAVRSRTGVTESANSLVVQATPKAALVLRGQRHPWWRTATRATRRGGSRTSSRRSPAGSRATRPRRAWTSGQTARPQGQRRLRHAVPGRDLPHRATTAVRARA